MYANLRVCMSLSNTKFFYCLDTHFINFFLASCHEIQKVGIKVIKVPHKKSIWKLWLEHWKKLRKDETPVFHTCVHEKKKNKWEIHQSLRKYFLTPIKYYKDKLYNVNCYMERLVCVRVFGNYMFINW